MATLDLIGIDTTTGQTKRFLSGDTVNGAGTGDVSLSGVQTITGAKTFNSSTLLLAGSTSGVTTLNAASVAGTTTITMPALTGTMVLSTTPSLAGFSWFLDEDTMTSDSATKVPSQQSVKAYVDAAVAGGVQIKGGYNASTNSPDLDTAPSGILAGDMYFVTVAGTFFSEALDVGDSIVANIDSPTALGDWTRVQRNLVDPITAASVTLANEATDTTCFVSFATAATGSQALYTNSGLAFNSATGTLTATAFSGPLTGNVTGDVTGNAGTVTVANEATDTSCFPLFAVSASGSLAPKTNAGLTFDSATSTLTATAFSGPLTGNVTGDVTGNVSGNAGTVTTANEATDTSCFLLFSTAASGSLSPKTNANLAFNSNTGALTLASVTATDYNTTAAQGGGALVEQKLSTTTAIDGTATGTTNLYTVPSGKTAIITRAVVRVTTADTITVAGAAGIGIAAGESDIFNSTVFTGLTATGKGYMFSNVMGVFATGVATDVIKLGIDTAFTATTATLAVDLFGYLV